MTTRKEKKRERKLKRFTQQLTDEQVQFLKAVGRQMSKVENPLIGIRFHCRTCAQSWEYGFDNKVVFCRTCHYRGSCIKDVTDFKQCNHCGRAP